MYGVARVRKTVPLGTVLQEVAIHLEINKKAHSYLAERGMYSVIRVLIMAKAWKNARCSYKIYSYLYHRLAG